MQASAISQRCRHGDGTGRSDQDDQGRYGANQQKRMFIYGRLDVGQTILSPSYGFGWTLSCRGNKQPLLRYAMPTWRARWGVYRLRVTRFATPGAIRASH